MRLTTTLLTIRTHRAIAGTAATLLGLVILGAGSAAAIDKGTFHDESSSSVSCPTMQLAQTQVVDGQFLGVQRGPNGLWYYREVSTYTTTWTNLANGKSMTEVVKGLIGKDQTIIDNGDGTLTDEVLSPSRVSVYGPDGRLAYQAAGNVTYIFLLDDNGTPQDPTDDNFLAYLGAVNAHGLDQTTGVCSEAAALLA
jgi:hypothetical protein